MSENKVNNEKETKSSTELIEAEKDVIYSTEGLKKHADDIPFIDENVQPDDTVVCRGIHESDKHRTHKNIGEDASDQIDETDQRTPVTSSRILNETFSVTRDDGLDPTADNKVVDNSKVSKSKQKRFRKKIKEIVTKSCKKNPASIKAVREENPDLLMTLVILNPKMLNEKDQNGDTALHVAIREGYFEMAHTLLGVRPLPKLDILNKKERSLLHEAALVNQPELAKRLLALGAYPDVADKYLVTPLIMATETGSLGVVQVLLQYNADTRLMDSTFRTAMDYASNAGYDPILDILLRRKAAIAQSKTEPENVASTSALTPTVPIQEKVSEDEISQKSPKIREMSQPKDSVSRKTITSNKTTEFEPEEQTIISTPLEPTIKVTGNKKPNVKKGRTTHDPSDVTVHEPSTLTTFQPSGLTVHEPSTLNTYQPSGLTVHEPSTLNTYQQSDITVHEPSNARMGNPAIRSKGQRFSNSRVPLPKITRATKSSLWEKLSNSASKIKVSSSPLGEAKSQETIRSATSMETIKGPIAQSQSDLNNSWLQLEDMERKTQQEPLSKKDSTITVGSYDPPKEVEVHDYGYGHIWKEVSDQSNALQSRKSSPTAHSTPKSVHPPTEELPDEKRGSSYSVQSSQKVDDDRDWKQSFRKVASDILRLGRATSTKSNVELRSRNNATEVTEIPARYQSSSDVSTTKANKSSTVTIKPSIATVKPINPAIQGSLTDVSEGD